MCRKNVRPGNAHCFISSCYVDICDELSVAGCVCKCNGSKVNAEEILEGLDKLRLECAAESLYKCSGDAAHYLIREDILVEDPAYEAVKSCFFSGGLELINNVLFSLRLRGVADKVNNNRNCILDKSVKSRNCLFKIRVVPVDYAEILEYCCESINVISAGENQNNGCNCILDCVRLVEDIVYKVLDIFGNLCVLKKSFNKSLDALAVFFGKGNVEKRYKCICGIACDILEILTGLKFACGAVIGLMCADEDDVAFCVSLSHLRCDCIPVKVKLERNSGSVDFERADCLVNEVCKSCAGNVDGNLSGNFIGSLGADIGRNDLFGAHVDCDCKRIYIVNFLEQGVNRSYQIFCNRVNAVRAYEVEDVCKS